MNINVTVLLRSLDGSVPLLNSQTGKDMMLREVLVGALISESPSESPNGEEKYRRYHLARKIQKRTMVELKSEEVVSLKRLVALIYPPLVVGQTFDLLEGTAPEDESEAVKDEAIPGIEMTEKG